MKKGGRRRGFREGSVVKGTHCSKFPVFTPMAHNLCRSFQPQEVPCPPVASLGTDTYVAHTHTDTNKKISENKQRGWGCVQGVGQSIESELDASGKRKELERRRNCLKRAKDTGVVTARKTGSD